MFTLLVVWIQHLSLIVPTTFCERYKESSLGGTVLVKDLLKVDDLRGLFDRKEGEVEEAVTEA
jgi:hypothetical protein